MAVKSLCTHRNAVYCIFSTLLKSCTVQKCHTVGQKLKWHTMNVWNIVSLFSVLRSLHKRDKGYLLIHALLQTAVRRELNINFLSTWMPSSLLESTGFTTVLILVQHHLLRLPILFASSRWRYNLHPVGTNHVPGCWWDRTGLCRYKFEKKRKK